LQQKTYKKRHKKEIKKKISARKKRKKAHRDMGKLNKQAPKNLLSKTKKENLCLLLK
jgi:hypothetical protein